MRRNRLIVAVVAAALVVGGGVTAAVLLTRGESGPVAVEPTPTDPASPEVNGDQPPALGGFTAEDEAIIGVPFRDPGAGNIFYFVMTDRFADGDPSNNTGGSTSGDPFEHGYNPLEPDFFQGGDIPGLIENLDYIEALGMTAIWITPPFVQRPVQGNCPDACSAAYHGYWITDFTDIDPRFGTKDDLRQLIEQAHERDMRVFIDIITNHTADVIFFDPPEYGYISQAERPYRDVDGNEFLLEDFVGLPLDQWPTLDPETSFPRRPVVTEADADLKVPYWLNDLTLYHNRGNSNWQGESVTMGDFFGLDDIMTAHPRVVEGFIEVYKAWIDLGVDGFRIDTVKHVNFEFWEYFTTAMLDHAASIGRPDFFMMGEVFDADARLLAPYVRGTDMNSVLDFAFQSYAVNFVQRGHASRLGQLFASDDHYLTPFSSAASAPTFLGNHDMGRVGFLLRSDRDTAEASRFAHELMFAWRGQPVVYYGDEQGFMGTGNDTESRQTMFPTRVEAWAEQPLTDGTSMGSRSFLDTEAPLFTTIAALSQMRQASQALTHGAQIERYSEGGTYAFSRVDRDERIEYLVIANAGRDEHTAEFRTLTPEGQFTAIWGEHESLTASADGTVSITVAPREMLVFRADRTVGATGEGTIELRGDPERELSGIGPVVAVVDRNAWSETSFAWRMVGESEWNLLGTSDSLSPRVFHDVSGLPPGAEIEYRAVNVDAAGNRIAVSSIRRIAQD